MKTAPFACPKCGAEREWRCKNDPTKNEMSSIKKDMIWAVFGAIGVGIAKLLYKGKRLKYHCDKCGFNGTYRPD